MTDNSQGNQGIASKPHFLAWLLWMTVVAGWAMAGIYTGVIPKLLLADSSFISLGILAAYLLAEAHGGWAAFNMHYPKWAMNTGRRYTGLTVMVRENLVVAGVCGTVFGIIFAFLPLKAAAGDPDALRQHLPEFFSGIAVSFIPAGVSFVTKAILNVSVYIREHGVYED